MYLADIVNPDYERASNSKSDALAAQKKDEAILYYDFGKSVAEKMLLSPTSASWADPVWSPDKAGAEEVGRGIWHVWGEVDASNIFNAKIHETWEVYFFSKNSLVLYARVGTVTHGSKEAAEAIVKAAGSKTP